MTTLYDIEDLEMLARDCLTRAGVGPVAARVVARDVALAEGFGERDAGFPALLRDIRLIRYGRLHPDAPVTIAAPAPAVLRVDAGHGFAAPAAAQAGERLADAARRHGIALLQVTRASDPGLMAGLLLDLAAAGLAAVTTRDRGARHAIAAGATRIGRLSGGGGEGLAEALLGLAPPVEDSPLDGPVASAVWITALDPATTGAAEMLADLPTLTGASADGADGIAVAPDLLAQIVNA